MAHSVLTILPHAVLETLRVSFPTMAEAMMRRPVSHAIFDQRLRSWAKKLLDAAQIDVCVSGRHHIAEGETYVIMSNHQSLYDIPVLFSSLPLSMRMVTKKELFRVPIWGRAMRAAGFIELDRSNRANAIESLKSARETMAGGISIWIAPEGTRTRTGKLGTFKQGGFHLALDTGRPILPVSIVGTREILRARDWRVAPNAKVHVTVSPSIDVSGYETGQRSELVQTVRTRIQKHLPAR